MLRNAILVALLLAAVTSPAHSQLRDRLKKVGITVKTGKDTAARKDTAAGRESASPRGSAVQTGAVAAEVKLPDSSSAHPEILGLKVGLSRVADVRRALAAVTPPLAVEEARAQLKGTALLGGRGQTQVPVDSAYVSSVSATTRAYSSPGQPGCGKANESKGNCESVSLEFSLPPEDGRLIYARRDIALAPMPTAETVEKSLIERFGTPTFRKARKYTLADHHEFTWTWAADGTLMGELPERHPCVQLAGGNFGFNGKATDARSAMLAGCTAAMRVQFSSTNTVVTNMAYTVRDFHGTYFSETKASELIKTTVAEWEKKDREAAAKVKIP